LLFFCIAPQVIEVCRRANPNLVVKRARFSALILRDLQRAVNNLVEPNEMDARAVDARQEIDLRIGASFTRFQTLLLQVSLVIDWTLQPVAGTICNSFPYSHTAVILLLVLSTSKFVSSSPYLKPADSALAEQTPVL